MYDWPRYLRRVCRTRGTGLERRSNDRIQWHGSPMPESRCLALYLCSSSNHGTIARIRGSSTSYKLRTENFHLPADTVEALIFEGSAHCLSFSASQRLDLPLLRNIGHSTGPYLLFSGIRLSRRVAVSLHPSLCRAVSVPWQDRDHAHHRLGKGWGESEMVRDSQDFAPGRPRTVKDQF